MPDGKLAMFLSWRKGSYVVIVLENGDVIKT